MHKLAQFVCSIKSKGGYRAKVQLNAPLDCCQGGIKTNAMRRLELIICGIPPYTDTS